MPLRVPSLAMAEATGTVYKADVAMEYYSAIKTNEILLFVHGRT